MRKVLFIAVVCVVVLFALKSISAQTKARPSDSNDAVMEKLDKILQNQAEMLDYLKFIKNRSH